MTEEEYIKKARELDLEYMMSQEAIKAPYTFNIMSNGHMLGMIAILGPLPHEAREEAMAAFTKGVVEVCNKNFGQMGTAGVNELMKREFNKGKK